MAHPSRIGGTMKRAVWIAIATGTMISGAAAVGVESPTANAAGAFTHAQRAAAVESARQAQRDMIEARYQADRARCDSLAGVRRDNCLIEAHARKGRAMLEAANPYSERG
jgi:hypothetical protein